ncbi:two-component system, CitB family, sensor kinase [Streptoalloteichus tenebrarius]|uniref:histidine kinase n=1 Tax=Streptoalloteichus tenebrarius (strain ATCC 17920 / DSM 40477 / JCM 4838 / CBS 697.72 / NBRC 16177 / NCIMB 11028 / NRRL B-12390 / A12253. 1 / ISP 5477) TaxID=1933 RepID=A0ABT1HWW4_STRSD|nr:sensor histidine kinase [Streptoalloteichus tenebrarius]MCP2260021.1 two-component system, CitB family, sensor kinase [Streptoalloteichus tenebrarius]BFF03863.1 sensor histidine kinase [Streptoalloteichus tenebrarius]
MSPPRMPFARQVLLSQVCLVTLVVGVGFALVGWLLERHLVHQYEQRALAVAWSVASDPDVAEAVAGDDPGRLVQARAERVRAATGALFVVVTDDRGIRFAHPNPEQLGRRVSTDPAGALAGNEVVLVEHGTLGLSARGKVPLRDRGGRIVGEVSVGFHADEIADARHRLWAFAGAFAGGALVLGLAGSTLLTRLLKRRTLGLEPHELAGLLQEREAVLTGIGEGVLAVDARGRVTVGNREAERLLGVRLSPGTSVDDLPLPPRLRAALAGDRVDNLITVAGNRVLVARHRPVRRDGRDLGGVLTLRDRTDLENLTRELDSVRGLTDALRAQRHEFANRLHTLSGLLQTNHHREAVEYLQALSAGPVAALGPGGEAVADPYLQSFLAAKTAAAEEKGVSLQVGPTSWVPSRVVAPVEVTTVVGNLVDNALEAARLGARRPAWVEVDLLAEGTTLHVSVVDSGDGVPERLRESVFAEGVSTRDGSGRGLGLALTRQTARGLGGEVRLAEPGGAGDGAGADGGTGHGAVFVARLPEVLDGVTLPGAEAGVVAEDLVGGGAAGSDGDGADVGERTREEATS